MTNSPERMDEGVSVVQGLHEVPFEYWQQNCARRECRPWYTSLHDVSSSRRDGQNEFKIEQARELPNSVVYPENLGRMSVTRSVEGGGLRY